MRNLGLEEQKKNPEKLHLRKSLFFKNNQYFRTIGTMAPLELLPKRQAVVFKAPCAYIGFPAIYIGLEPILEKKKSICFLLGSPTKTDMDFFFSRIVSRPI